MGTWRNTRLSYSVVHKLALSYSMTDLSMWYLPYLTSTYMYVCTYVCRYVYTAYEIYNDAYLGPKFSHRRYNLIYILHWNNIMAFLNLYYWNIAFWASFWSRNSCFRYLTAYKFINVASKSFQTMLAVSTIPLCMGLNCFVAFISHFSKKLNMGCFGLFEGQVRKWPCIPSQPPNFLT